MIDKAHAAIRVRFADEWGDTTPYQMPNVAFKVPSNAWVRVTIADAGANWASYGDPGNNVERNYGQVTTQIFTESGKGEGRGLELADKVRGIFRDWRDVPSGLRFLVPPYIQTIGIDGKWHQVNVVAPFQFDNFT